jgi:hypothetical protein
MQVMDGPQKHKPEEERPDLENPIESEVHDDLEAAGGMLAEGDSPTANNPGDGDWAAGAGAPFDTPPPEIIGSSVEPDTLPLLDELGNPPEMGTLHETLATWEAAAAAFPGDPHFQPRVTDKPREDLARIRRPFRPDVWLDRFNWTPVLAPDFQHAPQQLQQPFPLAPQTNASDTDQGSALVGAALVVRVRDINKHFLDALDARRQEMEGRTAWIIDDKLNEHDFWAAAEERAIYGK